MDIQNKNLHNKFKNIKLDIIINLAAQAGVRHSLKDPFSYINSNVLGQINLLEFAKKINVKKFIMQVPHPFMEEIRRCHSQ